MAEFFALCQSGDAGYNDGMKLIHKMLKKETGGWEKINNYSAFVAKGCRTARHAY